MKSMKQVFLFLCAACAVSLVVGNKLEAQAWQARHNLTPAQFQSTFDDLFKQGYRLKNMSGYVSNGERFAGLWVKESGPAWQARLGFPRRTIRRLSTIW